MALISGRSGVGLAGPTVQAPDAMPSTAASSPRTRRLPLGLTRADLVVFALYLICALLLFRLSVFQGWIFVGDSDRLNTGLNVRVFEVNQLQALGRVPAWTDNQLMGHSLSGLHWMLPGLTPVPYLLALLPHDAIFPALAVLAALLLALAMSCAYLAVRAYTSGPLPAAVGGLLYGLSSFATMKLVQLDLPWVVFVLMPLLFMVVRGTRRENAAQSFLWLALGASTILWITMLQEAMYVLGFLGVYAMFRSARLRDPWPLATILLAGLVSGLGSLPRILTVGQDFTETARTARFLETRMIETLRFFGDGLIGRFFGEQMHTLRGSGDPLNLHEGIQLLTSALAALAVLMVGLLSRSRLMRVLGLLLFVLLSMALGDYARSWYTLWLGNAQYPSQGLRTFLVNLDLLGLPLWLLVAWLARRRAAAGAEGGGPVRNATRETVLDAPFFLGFVVLALAIILIPEVRVPIYYLFLSTDFTHARLSVAMILPLAAMAAIFVNQFLPPRLTAASVRWVAAGLGVGLAFWLVREWAADAVVESVGRVLQTRPWRILTLEAVRVASSVLLMLVIAGVFIVRAPKLPGAVPGRALSLTGGLLIGVIVLETLVWGNTKFAGPQTTSQEEPFESYNHFNAPPGTLRPPTAAERAPVRERLEADEYRTVLYQHRERFPALVEPHMAVFWDLRLVEGYLNLPKRLAALPWAESMYSLHAVDLHATHAPREIPWKLLAALNVKYMVTVDRSLWFNPAPGGEDPPVDVAKLKIEENPYPVTPRAFFAARVVPAGTPALFPGDDGVRPPPKDPHVDDPARHSVVEGGWSAERAFPTSGTLTPAFEHDRITVQVDAASGDRFLVVNELYHPSWRAWVDGTPAEIYPTNLVMRGVLVPAGATSVELRYVPFMATWPGLALLAAGIALGVGIFVGLRRLTGPRTGPCAATGDRPTVA